jgi:predicted DNA-binding transcriptional regulator
VAVLGIYVVTLGWPTWLASLGLAITEADIPNVRLWVIAVPVLLAFIAIMGIGAWIGYTMATTPPPKPIEELTSEVEEKKEETPEPPKVEEEKKPERKKKEEK